MERRQSLQQLVLGKLYSYMPINEIRTFPHTILKINSKWFKDLNVRLNTVKLLEENRKNTDINRSDIFLDLPPKVMKIKTKINKWDLIKSFFTARSDQIRSVTQSCPALCDPMNRSTPGLPIDHQLPEFTQTHVH